MEPHDRVHFIALMAGVAETYGRKPLSEAAFEIFWQALHDVSLSAVRDAITRHVRTSPYFPKPSDLRTVLSGEDMARLAWIDVQDAIEQVGTYLSVHFQDAVTAATIEAMGGWVALGRPTEKWEWVERRFLDTYQALLHRPVGTFPDVPLLGIFEIETAIPVPARGYRPMAGTLLPEGQRRPLLQGGVVTPAPEGTDAHRV